MAATIGSSTTSKSSKWFFNKSLKLSLPRRRKSDTLSSNPPSPMSPARLSSPRMLTPTPSTMSPSRRFGRRGAREGYLEEVFRHFDADGDGKISSLELKTYFASIGEYLSIEEAQGFINDLDIDGDGLMNLCEFTQLMERDAVDDDIKRAFEMFEAEKGSGCITPKSLQRMLNRLGDEKSHEQCKAMIRAYDLDENGMLDFHEFHLMMA